MAAINLFTGIRSIGILALLFAGLAHAQTGSTNTDPSADSQIRKNAPSMQKDGTGASTTAGAPVSKGDVKMMRDMAHSNLAEIETGKLALEKSQSPEVKKFAQQMIDDHTQAQTELQKLAQTKGVELPSKPDKKWRLASSIACT
jgi:putative membrane protein